MLSKRGSQVYLNPFDHTSDTTQNHRPQPHKCHDSGRRRGLGHPSQIPAPSLCPSSTSIHATYHQSFDVTKATTSSASRNIQSTWNHLNHNSRTTTRSSTRPSASPRSPSNHHPLRRRLGRPLARTLWHRLPQGLISKRRGIRPPKAKNPQSQRKRQTSASAQAGGI